MTKEMINAVFIKEYQAPPINRREILRYLGVKEETAETAVLVDSCIKEAQDRLSYRVCWGEFLVEKDGETLDLCFCRTCSKNLCKNLSGCQSIVLFAATVGLELDRLIAKYNRLQPSRAVVLQALGSERIEALCDAFNADITKEKAAEGKGTRPRFSPGYGDLTLEVQKDIFAALNCSKNIGISLNQSLLMTPSKSVTAIIGIHHS